MQERIEAVIRELEAFMATVTDARALPRPAAEFLHALILARAPRQVVEIGTSYGYSGLWVAAGLPPGGRLITIDRQPHKHDRARSWFEAAGLTDRVELRTGEALDILPLLPGPIDFVLNDADKPDSITYIESVLPNLSERAIILTDNVLSHAALLEPFMSWVRRRPEFFTLSVPIGNGMDLSVRRAGRVSTEVRA
ncbi:MAG TPA: O-methyltransferase [Phycisphaerae bacterium]|nr:O-methyltransferase [Phycisphaerae bacterium]HNU44593.1 O-methyltransferase [Phycisphaerae bacterium]